MDLACLETFLSSNTTPGLLRSYFYMVHMVITFVFIHVDSSKAERSCLCYVRSDSKVKDLT